MYYSIGAEGSTPAFTGSTTPNGTGDGWVPLDVGTSPVHVIAYVDRAAAGAVGAPDTTEAAGTTVVIGMDV